MEMDSRLSCEFVHVSPESRLCASPFYDERAERAWWADYRRRHPTFWMRLARWFQAAAQF